MKHAILIPLALLAACGPANRSLDTQKAAVVRQSEASFDIASAGGNLDPAQARAFGNYLAALGAGYGDRVSATATTGVQRAQLDAMLKPYGLVLDASPNGPALPGAVRVTIRQSSASVPGCPDWRRAANPEIDASTMSNHGCGVRANLAAMVADPTELIEGKTYSGPDGATVTKGIAAYRTKPATGLQPLDRGDVSTRGER